LIFVGDDWSEEHHDIEVMDEDGATLERRRLPEGLNGVGRLHELLAGHRGRTSVTGRDARVANKGRLD
jgi:hypothetical protein